MGRKNSKDGFDLDLFSGWPREYLKKPTKTNFIKKKNSKSNTYLRWEIIIIINKFSN